MAPSLLQRVENGKILSRAQAEEAMEEILSGRGFPLLQLQGLDQDAEYKLNWIEGKASPETPATASGAWWMRHGIQLDLRGDFQAAAFHLDRQR